MSSLDDLAKRFDLALKKFPERRRVYHVRIGERALGMVRGEIGGTGKVQGWQENYVGSRGGYAAVRPRPGKHGKYAVGYVTNAIENGHRTRMSKKGGARRRRGAKDFVLGRGFYRAVINSGELENAALEEAELLMDEIESILEGTA